MHLGAYYSRGERYLDSLRASIAEADIVWMLGDIFECKSTYLPIEQVIANAKLRVREWCSAHPEKPFIWVTGNHESYKGRTEAEVLTFIRAMEDFSQELAGEDLHHFHVAENRHAVKLGGLVGLHGDATEYTPKSIERPFTPGAAEKPKHVIHQWLDHTQKFPGTINRDLHIFGNIIAPGWLASVVMHPFEKHARGLLEVIQQDKPEWLAQVTDIVDGHIHHPYRDQTLNHGEHGHIRFHNLGAAIAMRSQFKPMMFTLDAALNVIGRELRDPDHGGNPIQRLLEDFPLVDSKMREGYRVQQESKNAAARG